MNRSESADCFLGVDVGGTFTDAVLVTPGAVWRAKAPTTPGDQSVGSMAAIGEVLAAAGLEPGRVTSFSHGMTVATNALIEGRVARTVFVATEGFTDLVDLGRQDRPSLYALTERRPAGIADPGDRVGVRERNTPDGPLLRLTPGETGRVVSIVEGLGPEAVAVCLLHSYRHPDHEKDLGEALEACLGPGVPVVLSHHSVGTFREYERAATTEVEASLAPLMTGYLERLSARCRAEGLPEPAVMQSSGGLTDTDTAGRHPARTLLSGPAGGAAAAVSIARRSGCLDLIGLDMGGTSCDVSVVEDGRIREAGTRDVAGRPIALPSVDIETVGAGGGSIAWLDGGGALRVGPRSAGAEPGPACYGRGGGEPTVTDANLVLGRLGDSPALSGVSLDRTAAEGAITALANEMGVGVVECARGVLEVANAEMVRAVRLMTVDRGLDPAGFSLLAFGGAGPLHAIAIAGELGIDSILVPRDGGVLSALGLATADRRHDEVRTVLAAHGELDRDALVELHGGADAVSWDMRYRGQSFELEIEVDTAADDLEPDLLRGAFEEAHRTRYGFLDPEAEVELVTVRRRFLSPGPSPVAPETAESTIRGPASVDLGVATIWLDEGWEARDPGDGLIRIRRSEKEE